MLKYKIYLNIIFIVYGLTSFSQSINQDTTNIDGEWISFDYPNWYECDGFSDDTSFFKFDTIYFSNFKDFYNTDIKGLVLKLNSSDNFQFCSNVEKGENIRQFDNVTKDTVILSLIIEDCCLSQFDTKKWNYDKVNNRLQFYIIPNYDIDIIDMESKSLQEINIYLKNKPVRQIVYLEFSIIEFTNEKLTIIRNRN